LDLLDKSEDEFSAIKQNDRAADQIDYPQYAVG
jgi:hypothetical protein